MKHGFLTVGKGDQEEEMRMILISWISLALAGSSAEAHPRDGANAPNASYRIVHHMAKFTKATALATPAVITSEPALRDTSGLSRDVEDCARYGCIDN
jgi:hypothetical protein